MNNEFYSKIKSKFLQITSKCNKSTDVINSENDIKKTSVRLIMAFCLLLTACIAAGILSLSWFAETKKISANEINLTTSSPNFYNLEIQTYFISSGEKIGDNRVFYPALSETGDFISSNKMPTYDKYGIEKSEYEKMLAVKISFMANETEKNFKLTAMTSNEFNALDSNYISNCLLFTTAKYSNEANSLFAENNSTSFVTFGAGETVPKKQNTVDVLTFTPNAEQNVLWVLLEYNENVMNYFFENSQNTANQTISFANDVTFELSEVQP